MITNNKILLLLLQVTLLYQETRGSVLVKAKQNEQTPLHESASELYRPSYRRLSANFCG
jgi:hypothetical protein